jgi:hypothetical protein
LNVSDIRRLYGDDELRYTANVNLYDWFRINQGDPQSAFVGFSGSNAPTLYSGQYIRTWTARSFDTTGILSHHQIIFERFIDEVSGNLYITCFGSYTLYYNGTNIGTGNNTYTADPYFGYSLQPGDVIAFQGKRVISQCT